mmetsp:Transcript_18180/g.32560  ORF Transcript_18180/g.32560 Transcript_18180/m.32560 type:complete len:220 (-) Transcript_18180:184-843(-)
MSIIRIARTAARSVERIRIVRSPSLSVGARVGLRREWCERLFSSSRSSGESAGAGAVVDVEAHEKDDAEGVDDLAADAVEDVSLGENDDPYLELKQQTTDVLLSYIAKHGPVRRPQIWNDCNEQLQFKTKQGFKSYLSYLCRQKAIKRVPSEEIKNHMSFVISSPSKWELAEMSTEELQLADPTWHTMLPEDPVEHVDENQDGIGEEGTHPDGESSVKQ